jgi:hypothetical protein
MLHRDQRAVSKVFLAAALGTFCSGTVSAEKTKVIHQPETIAFRVAKLRQKLSNEACGPAVEDIRDKTDSMRPMQWVNWVNWPNWHNWLNWGNY